MIETKGTKMESGSSMDVKNFDSAEGQHNKVIAQLDAMLDDESLASFDSWQSKGGEDLDEMDSEDVYGEIDEEWTRYLNNVYFEEYLPHAGRDADLQSGQGTSQSAECEICLGRADVRRSCCKLYFCEECMTTYINTKVSEGRYQIECPGNNCRTLLHHDRIEESLTPEMQHKFLKFFTDANADPCSKTCPCCGTIYSIDPDQLKKSKRKLRKGIQVACPQCKFVWCFLCQAPYHTGLTCKEYRKGDAMVRKWAKEWSYGQFNAQKCPKCKIFIQKAEGCDHMCCSHCKTDFCYRCGGRYIRTKYLGNHLSRFSIFGCKYRFLPNRPALRRLVRGASFAACVGGGIILAALGLALGAGLIGASVIIVPGYGIFRLRKHMWRKRQRKMFEDRRVAVMENLFTNMVAREAALRPLWGLEAEEMQANAAAGQEVELGDGMDTQQVHVIVHRSMSMNREDAASKFACGGAAGTGPLEEREERGFFVNKYTAEGSEMVVVTSLSGEGTSQGNGSDSVITVTDFKEIPSSGGYTTLVANIVSRSASKAVTSVGSDAPSATDADGDGEAAYTGARLEKDRSEGFDEALTDREGRKCSESTKNTVEKSGTKEKAKDDNGKGEKFEGRQRRRSASFPRNARELVQACARPDCLGYSRKVTSKQPDESQQGEGRGGLENEEEGDFPVVCPDLGISDKDITEEGHGYNGCFGNIFSKLGQGQQSSGPQTGNSVGARSKYQQGHAVGSQKSICFGRKSSTWEKTRRDCVQALLLSRALSSASSGGVETDCSDLQDPETIRMSNMTSCMTTDKASLSQILARISQLDQSEATEDSLLLGMSELDLSEIRQLLLEDFLAGRSKKFSKKLLQQETDDVDCKGMKLKKEYEGHTVGDQGFTHDVEEITNGSFYAQSGGQEDITKNATGSMSRDSVKRRRSMVEMGTGGLCEDARSALGNGGSFSNISLDRDVVHDASSSVLDFECNISPQLVITRL